MIEIIQSVFSDHNVMKQKSVTEGNQENSQMHGNQKTFFKNQWDKRRNQKVNQKIL